MAKELSYYGKITWLYTKYQILTKGFLSIIIFPLLSFVQSYFLSLAGKTTISSGDYLGFIFSVNGLGFLVATLAVLTILIATDVNAFIMMSALIYEGRIDLKARDLFLIAIKSLRNFLKPSGFLIMIYIAIVVPLVGIGVGVSVTENFKIPNFITDVIFKNTLYSILYSSVIFILSFFTVRHIFLFHYMLIDNNSVQEAFNNSAKLMRNNYKEFIKKFFVKLVFLSIIMFAVVFVLLFAVLLPINYIEDDLMRRISLIFAILIISELFAFITLMTVPFICNLLTKLFYEFNKKDGRDISIKFNHNALEHFKKKVRLRTKISLSLLIIVVIGINLIVSAFFGVFFDEIFRSGKQIDIVAHRGGGDLAAENSLKGLEMAIKEKVQWSEFDVQRTKDGKYIINHDKNFQRLSGVDKKSSEMTLDEIKQLKVKDLFNEDGTEEPVATLEEYLDTGKGKIGLFIELKGETADEKMVDDVVAMVKQKDMLKEVALLSLDYNLINYIEEKYPEVDTGYLYFFSFGDTEKLVGDILIMEEEEATPSKVEAIKNKGKKAIVWTVNTEESIHKFLNSNVDGIITDYVLKLKEGMRKEESRSDIEIIMDSFFNK